MKSEIELAIYFAPFIAALIIAYFSFRKKMAAWKVFLIVWGTLIVGYVIISVLIPLVLVGINKEYFRDVFGMFPEPPIVVAILFLGWLHSLVVVAVGWSIAKLHQSIQRQPN